MAPAAAMAKKEEGFGEAAGEGGMKRKKTMGRQKIEIKRITNEDKRQVCFSKRKDGLLKKASDLAVLCGGHVAAIAFSPGGKPFSFGHPSVEALIDRFMGRTAPAMGPVPVHPGLLEEVSREEDLLTTALEAEAGRKKALEAAMGQAGVWTGGVHGKSAQDLLAMCSALEKVQADVADRLHQEFMAKEAMTHQYTAAMGADVGGVFHYPGAGAFMADGGASSHHQDKVVMDDTTMTMVKMGGSVEQPLPFAPTTMPPPPPLPLPPYAPPLPLPPYAHCFDLNLGPGYEDGPVFGVHGFYGAMTCMQPF